MLCGAATTRLAAVVAGMCFAACGKSSDPVAWRASINGANAMFPGAKFDVRIDAHAGRGWYIYSVTQPPGGPIATAIRLSDTAVFREGAPLRAPQPDRAFDNAFDMMVEKYRGSAVFRLPVVVRPDAKSGARSLGVSASYQACNDNVCLPPRTVTLSVPVNIRAR